MGAEPERGRVRRLGARRARRRRTVRDHRRAAQAMPRGHEGDEDASAPQLHRASRRRGRGRRVAFSEARRRGGAEEEGRTARRGGHLQAQARDLEAAGDARVGREQGSASRGSRRAPRHVPGGVLPLRPQHVVRRSPRDAGGGGRNPTAPSRLQGDGDAAEALPRQLGRHLPDGGAATAERSGGGIP